MRSNKNQSKLIKKMKILANAQIKKLKEYSMSYGSEVTEDVAYIKVFTQKIELYDDFGRLSRTMRIGTKILKSWNGKEITERAFKMRTKRYLDNFQKSVQDKKNTELEKEEVFRKEMLVLFEFAQKNWAEMKAKGLQVVDKLGLKSNFSEKNIRDALYNKNRENILKEAGLI